MASLLVHDVVDEVLAADKDLFEVEISVQVAPGYNEVPHLPPPSPVDELVVVTWDIGGYD